METETLAAILQLRLRTKRLELRLPTRDELVAFAELARAGIHPPETMPFRIAWTDAAGEPDFVDRFIAYHQEQRAAWRPERWVLALGVWAEGKPAGSQSIEATDFVASSTVETGSWLGARFQRRGFGTELPTAVLELAFAGLGAEVARSGFMAGNEASEGVSRKLGYEHVGEAVVAPRGEPVRELVYELTRARWHETRRTRVEIEGLEPCLPLFGLAPEHGGG